MAERMGCGRLGQPGAPHGLRHGSLDHGFVKVMPVPDARVAVGVEGRRRKHILPTPLTVRAGIFRGECEGQRRAAQAPAEILPVELSNVPQVCFHVLAAERG